MIGEFSPHKKTLVKVLTGLLQFVIGYKTKTWDELSSNSQIAPGGPQWEVYKVQCHVYM